MLFFLNNKTSLNKIFIITTMLSLLSSCGTTSTIRHKNICSLMDDKISWYKAVKKVEQNRLVDRSLILAFIKQESSFNGSARPPKKEVLGFIPFGRESSAFGFSQAKNETWDWYRKKANRPSALRDDFADSSDFIAWYVLQTTKMTGIKTDDVYNQYLAYHEGQNGFQKGTYNTKPWLLNVAQKVAISAKNYKTNLQTCENRLNNTYGWSFF